LAKRFQRGRFLEIGQAVSEEFFFLVIDQPETKITDGGHVC
jgi:hypothetical protein